VLLRFLPGVDREGDWDSDDRSNGLGEENAEKGGNLDVGTDDSVNGVVPKVDR